MKISEVKVTPIKPDRTLIGFCSFLVDEGLLIGDVALHYSPERTNDPYWLVYPSKILFNGKQINTVRPINRETELLIKKAVVKEYEQWLERIRENKSRRGVLRDEQGKE